MGLEIFARFAICKREHHGREERENTPRTHDFTCTSAQIVCVRACVETLAQSERERNKMDKWMIPEKQELNRKKRKGALQEIRH